jgi:hypothetical protein
MICFPTILLCVMLLVYVGKKLQDLPQLDAIIQCFNYFGNMYMITDGSTNGLFIGNMYNHRSIY